MVGRQDASGADACSVTPGWLPTGDGETTATWFGPTVPLDAHRHTAVVVVGGILHEEQTTAVGLVALARDLAAHGIAALLVDLAGSANGRGRLSDPGIGGRWDDDIRSAVAHARDLGFGHIVVLGVRSGALLAAHACTGDPVDELVMWAPVLSGRRLVRELQVMAAASSDGAAAPDDGIVVAGHHLVGSTLDHLRSLDAGRLPGKPAARCTVVDTAERIAALDPAHPLVGEGAGDRIVAARTDDWLFTASDEFPAPFEDLLLVRRHLVTLSAAAASVTSGGSLSSAVPAAPLPTGHVLTHDGRPIREQMVEFGGDRPGATGPLRGILTEPSGTPDRSVAIVGVTTVGPGRLFVDLARDGAAHGVSVLRFDLSGFGISDRRRRGGWADHYRTDASQDIDAAVDHLLGLGYRSVRIVGFCAGAWAAVHVAPRAEIAGIVAVNVELAVRTRLLHRRVWPGMSRPAAMLATFGQRRRVHWFVERLENRLPWAGPGARGVGRHVASGADVVLAFADVDIGLRYYRSRVARPAGLAPRRRPDVAVYPGLGHLPGGAPRSRLLADILTR